MGTTLRNVLIVLALAAAVHFIPGGGNAADALAAILSTGILVAFVLIGARFYRERRMDFFALGDRWRGILYGALALAIFAMAARSRLFDLGGAGVLLWLAMLGGTSYALYRVWRHHKDYAF